jgi:hypothetical protein
MKIDCFLMNWSGRTGKWWVLVNTAMTLNNKIRERTTPTERQPHFGKVSDKF